MKSRHIITLILRKGASAAKANAWVVLTVVLCDNFTRSVKELGWERGYPADCSLCLASASAKQNHQPLPDYFVLTVTNQSHRHDEGVLSSQTPGLWRQSFPWTEARVPKACFQTGCRGRRTDHVHYEGHVKLLHVPVPIQWLPLTRLDFCGVFLA